MFVPYLRRQGEKTRALPIILPQLLQGNRYVEPFIGGGSVFLNVSYPEYLLTDSNLDIITLHIAVRDNLKRVIKDTAPLFKCSDEKLYAKFKNEYNASQDDYERAVLFLYLNHHAVNYTLVYDNQENLVSSYNPNHQGYYPEQELHEFHQHSQNAVFKCQSYKRTLSEVKEGDVVYCNTPLVRPRSKYQQLNKVFNIDDEVKLKSLLSSLTVPIVT